MIETVGERGYQAVTVRDIVRRAGVSSRTFYEHFAGKEECFLATCELLARRSVKRVGAAQQGCRDWRERLQLAFWAWTRGIAREPGAARLALVEAFAGGPAALERMRRAEDVFEAMLAQSFACAPDRVAVPRLVVKGIVAGVQALARARLLDDRAHELPGLARELLEWALCFRCPAAAALAPLGERSAPVLGGALTAGRRGRGTCEDDRARVLDAAARLAAQAGFEKLTAARIRAIAGVSRRRFDELFCNVDECFITAFEHDTGRALAQAVSAGTAGRTWPGGLHRALSALCAQIAADPASARLQFIEILSLGLDGMHCRARIIDGIARDFLASAPDGQRASVLAAEASVGAIWGIIQRHVVSDRADRLPPITPTLSYLALAPALGAQQAVEAIALEQARVRAGRSRRRPPTAARRSALAAWAC